MGYITMDDPPHIIRTALIDLTDVHFAALRDWDEAVLEPGTRRLLAQIEQVRTNIGGTGPPGRVD